MKAQPQDSSEAQLLARLEIVMQSTESALEAVRRLMRARGAEPKQKGTKR